MFANKEFPYIDYGDFNMKYKPEPSNHVVVNLSKIDPMKKTYKLSNNYKREKQWVEEEDIIG